MKKVSDFIYNNKIALLIGLASFGIYLYFAMAGNRICDCESTENYKPTGRSSVNHFYHK